MRLWHEKLIPLLPRQQLLGQHRECCALRGNGWGKKHATVDYVFKHPWTYLVEYHFCVISEMYRRGYNVNVLWMDETYRGKNCEKWKSIPEPSAYYTECIYPEHDDAYLQECIDNLAGKGIVINKEDIK